MKHNPRPFGGESTVSERHIETKKGCILHVLSTTKGNLVLATSGLRRKHNRLKNSQMFLSRNSAATMTLMLLLELGCETADDVAALIDTTQLVSLNENTL